MERKDKYTPEQLAELEAETKKNYIDNFNSQLSSIDASLKDKKKAADFQKSIKKKKDIMMERLMVILVKIVKKKL